MKVFLLGLDGLEYETVIQEKCIQLMQNQFCKIVVPIDREYGFPRSPTVWASFLTGTLYQCDFKYSPIQRALYRLKKWFPFLKFGLFKRVSCKPKEFETLTLPTLFDMIPNSKAFNVPYVNYKPETFRIAHEFGKNNLSIDEALFQSLELCEKRKHELFQEVSEALEYDFVMAFIHFPDIVQHLGFLSRGVIEHHYHGLNSFVSELRHRISKDAYFFILSDHGFDRNTALHSNHGFFSSNIKLENKPKSIFEVHELIKHHLLED